MCAACGIPTHISEPEAAAPATGAAPPPAGPPRRFAALRNRDCRPYLFGSMLAMMADNIEHVITYWVLWQTFHSPALTGFQVISHWVPFLLLSMWFGSLADRYDCRRVIQVAQAVFMGVSAAWGILFLTGSLHMWEACVLLVLHGLAGSLWGPGEQLMLHDFVGPAELSSAVRLNATFRSLGVLFGPVIGSALLLGLGPTAGIFANIAFYLPLTFFLFRTKFTGHTRDRHRRPRVGALESLRVLREVGSHPTLVSMIVLAGLGSFFVGASLQSSMPIFAHDLGAGGAGTAYGVLLFANGAGGVIGGIVLEATGWVRPRVAAAVLSTALYGLTSIFFALTTSYPLALALLLVGGIANLASMSIGQTVVQLLAPAADRGRVLGVYGMSAGGLRAGSGFTVGLLGAAIGVRTSLAYSATALCVGTAAAGLHALRGRRVLSGRGPVREDRRERAPRP
ncbi:MFS transporter [Streptomyces sp. H39-S7]|uniref:MFS transporter n=1 Tax=Streptomyces sp. H39-S7 TaxID=3004357 RepID=UPI0022AFEEB7|nr:MFS transporter [Streptomyces sp. H39-S7]MCZ4121003.1 MFS transporter [Streptomyces sp. H39-S7]